MIKLIVSDVDDTLLPESTMDLNPEYYDVIRKLQDKGIRFVAASGRQKVSIKKVFAPIQDEIDYIADNGTDISAGDFQHCMKFDAEDYKKLAQDLEMLNDRGFAYMPSMPDWSFVDEKKDELFQVVSGYGCQLKKVPDLTSLSDISKVSLYNSQGIPEELERNMKERWSDKLDVCIAGKWYLDFTQKGCNKGKALEILQKHYGISYEETVAFGNADNDIPLIKQAKYGYAVGNASEGLKKASYEVLAPMQEDAVLAKLKEILEMLEK